MAIEDFTTYSIRPDPLVKTTVTVSRVSWVALWNQDDDLVYDDKGADHFGVDFEHILEVYIDACVNMAYHGFWALADYANDFRGIVDGNKDCFILYIGRYLDANFLGLRELVAGTTYSSASYAFALDTLYYLRIKRDSGVGPYGTLYCDVYASEADRTNEENALANLSLALHDPAGYENGDAKFRYVYGLMANDGAGTYGQTAYTQNLDLQEVPPPVAKAYGLVV